MLTDYSKLLTDMQNFLPLISKLYAKLNICSESLMIFILLVWNSFTNNLSTTKSNALRSDFRKAVNKLTDQLAVVRTDVAAAGIPSWADMSENRFAALEASEDDDRLPYSEVVNRRAKRRRNQSQPNRPQINIGWHLLWIIYIFIHHKW